ncbi:LexA family protein [Bordetella genomosp. 13]|uniref:LexA family protein n=1 Tax=Bordetella genomosp. 13 TaxID=463040 RepID=UPI00119F8A9A|nr:LexA family transcriptional regulator [Bordetella genomosp. 13]
MSLSVTAHRNARELVQEAGSLARFAEIVGISPAQAWQIAGDDPRRGIGAKMADRIERAFNKPTGWLYSAGGPSGEDLGALGNVRRIPVLNYVQAGNLTDVGVGFAGETLEYLVSDLGLSDRAFALIVRGLSMAPMFQPGDKIIVDQDLSPSPGSFVIAMNGGEEATFKKYRPRGVDPNGNEIFELVPLNEDFASLYSDRQPLSIVGTVVEHRRYLK